MSTPLDELRTSVRMMRVAHEEASEACAALMAHERRDHNSFAELHHALRRVGEALQQSTAAQRRLAIVLALDPHGLASENIDALVPPILEHE